MGTERTSGEEVQALSFCLGLTETGSEESNLAMEVKQVRTFRRTSVHPESIRAAPFALGSLSCRLSYTHKPWLQVLLQFIKS